MRINFKNIGKSGQQKVKNENLGYLKKCKVTPNMVKTND